MPRVKEKEKESSANWLLPSPFDLDHLLKKHTPKFSYKKDYFYHLVDVIARKMDFLDPSDRNLRVNLQAKQLQSFNENYKRYVEYLKEVGVITVDDHYQTNEYTKGYKLTADYYNGEVYSIPVEDYTIKKKYKNYIAKVHKERLKNTENYTYLTKWFNDNLTIDREAAIAEVDKLFPLYYHYHSGDTKIGGKLLYRKNGARHKALRTIARIHAKDFSYNVDSTIGRFHSNLTNLKKELRKHISFKGQKLVSIDIKNSQPLLSNILLNQQFYSSPLLNQINNNIPISTINYWQKNILSIIMLRENDVNSHQKEFCEYLRMSQSGRFYEELQSLLNQPGLTREEVKEYTYILFFADNRHGPKLRKKEQPFVQKFPHIYQIFCLIKRKGKRYLPALLQRTESFIVIENAARRIGEEKPQLPIFTIHDSMITTQGNEKYIAHVLKEEIKRITNLDAKLSIENWQN